jgi:hypothetical protein
MFMKSLKLPNKLKLLNETHPMMPFVRRNRFAAVKRRLFGSKVGVFRCLVEGEDD